MERLPPLPAGPLRWRLPLSGATACELAGALTAADQERQSRVLNLLARDPLLTLWSACLQSSTTIEPPLSLPDVGNWLSEHGWRELGKVEAGESGETSERYEAIRETFVTSVAACGAARDPHLQLCGLLHGAADWLAACGPALDNESTAVAESPLPAWLVELLETYRPPRSASSGRAHDQAELAWSAWSTDPPGAAGLLPQLVEMKLQLDVLSAHFDETLQREKLAAMKELAYGAGHEVNNPLANISTRAQTLLQDETNPERRRKLATINSQAFRAHEMIADLMLFAKPPQLQSESIDIVQLMDTVIGELADQARGQETQISRPEHPATLRLQADPDHLAVALRALCMNSLEAIGHGGRIEIVAERRSCRDPLHRPRQIVSLVIRDTGPGITPEARRHLFDPFYSGREAGRGLGFGLSKCWRIVEQHGGTIRVDSPLEQGAMFTIELPDKAE